MRAIKQDDKRPLIYKDGALWWIARQPWTDYTLHRQAQIWANAMNHKIFVQRNIEAYNSASYKTDPLAGHGTLLREVLEPRQRY